MIRVESHTAPAHWAPALVNGDDSGLDPEDAKAAADWTASLAPGHVAGTEEEGPGFLRWHDAAPFAPYAADCAAFIIYFQEESKP